MDAPGVKIHRRQFPWEQNARFMASLVKGYMEPTVFQPFVLPSQTSARVYMYACTYVYIYIYVQITFIYIFSYPNISHVYTYMYTYFAVLRKMASPVAGTRQPCGGAWCPLNPPSCWCVDPKFWSSNPILWWLMASFFHGSRLIVKIPMFISIPNCFHDISWCHPNSGYFNSTTCHMPQAATLYYSLFSSLIHLCGLQKNGGLDIENTGIFLSFWVTLTTKFHAFSHPLGCSSSTCSWMFDLFGRLKLILVGGLVAIFYFPINIGNNHPNWLIFFRGVAQPPTSIIVLVTLSSFVYAPGVPPRSKNDRNDITVRQLPKSRVDWTRAIGCGMNPSARDLCIW